MPSLSLSNSVSKSYNRVTTICISQNFNVGTTTFTGTDTSACGVVDVDGDGSKMELHITASSNNGYGSRSFTTHPGTTYNYSIDFVTPSIATVLKIGTSAGDGTHVSRALSNSDPGYGTITGSFTATTKATHISLVTTAATRTGRWDNLTISEDN
tara:strand:+ start:1456 stop:1920 length:465 start_codon:yes stop_codon:yes gene_type:complete